MRPRGEAPLGREGYSPKRYVMVQADSLSAVDPVSGKIRDLVAGIAEALVDHPDRVSVEAIVEPTSTILRLRVDPSDVGKIIGKQGRTARSMRTILSAASMKLHHRFSLDIVEENTSTPSQEA
jgi:uncharacterized protein